jgi:hypothetical protein
MFNFKKITKKKKILIIVSAVILFLLFLSVWFFKFANNYPLKTDLKYKSGYFGVTYSAKMATQLGLDWQEAYLAVLDDLGVREIRIPVYWDQIESESGQYDFSKYDWMLSEGAKRDAKFIVNIGYRLPRWPECHAPVWVDTQSDVIRHQEILLMLSEVVKRYKDRDEIKYWQVENEPFLDVFGVCPKSDPEFLQEEVALVRSLDSRPIIISGSGELSTWRKESSAGDIFATTLYRVVWGERFGYIRYPIPAWIYSLKANINHIPEGKRIISELQAEPWVPEGSLGDLSSFEAKKSLDINQFKANAQYAINVNFDKSYLWGVEWWYEQSKNGHPEYWDFAKTLFK